MNQNFALRTAGGLEYPILGQAYIGRDADCLIRYDDPSISRHHARLWTAEGGLWLTDDNSANGLFLNGWQIMPAKIYQLQVGDRLRLGGTEIELVAVLQTNPIPSSPAAIPRRLPPLMLVGIFGCLLACGLGLLTSAYFLFLKNRSGIASHEATIMAAFTPEPLLKPQEYAAASQALVQAVADLNQAELAFIQAANGAARSLPKGSPVRFARQAAAAGTLDEKLRQVAANAMRVAGLADSLNKTAAAQGNGSPQAEQVAGQYGSVAQLGAALVIETQDLRTGLAQGSLTKSQAAATMAEYGARLWNPAVTGQATGPGSPFVAYLNSPAGIPVPEPLSVGGSAQLAQQTGPGLSAWVAASAEKTTKTFNLPSLAGTTDQVNDPVLLANLSTAEGQGDSRAAKQVAAAMLQADAGTTAANAQTTETQVVAAFFSAVAVSSPNNLGGTTPPRNLPAFPQGTATLVSETSADEISSNLLTLDSQNDPTLIAQIPVKETNPFVSLNISNITIQGINQRAKNEASSFEADVSYEFDVKWSTNLTAPQFVLDCSGGNHFEISTTNGSQHVSAKMPMILFPGTENTYCYANHNGNSWGSTSVRFLVGDAAGATRRADQVETESANLNLALTVDAHGTQVVEAAKAAGTLTVQAIENAVSTEVYGTQTAEFRALITEIARQTEQAPPPQATETPLPTATFTPVLIETLFHRGDVFAVSSSAKLERGHLYQICLTGIVNLTTGPAVPSDLDHVNGVKVPLSGCLVLEGTGSVATISCGSGEAAADPGGFTVKIYDLGPD